MQISHRELDFPQNRYTEDYVPFVPNECIPPALTQFGPFLMATLLNAIHTGVDEYRHAGRVFTYNLLGIRNYDNEEYIKLFKLFCEKTLIDYDQRRYRSVEESAHANADSIVAMYTSAVILSSDLLKSVLDNQILMSASEQVRAYQSLLQYVNRYSPDSGGRRGDHHGNNRESGASYRQPTNGRQSRFINNDMNRNQPSNAARGKLLPGTVAAASAANSLRQDTGVRRTSADRSYRDTGDRRGGNDRHTARNPVSLNQNIARPGDVSIAVEQEESPMKLTPRPILMDGDHIFDTPVVTYMGGHMKLQATQRDNSDAPSSRAQDVLTDFMAYPFDDVVARFPQIVTEKDPVPPADDELSQAVAAADAEDAAEGKVEEETVTVSRVCPNPNMAVGVEMCVAAAFRHNRQVSGFTGNPEITQSFYLTLRPIDTRAVPGLMEQINKTNDFEELQKVLADAAKSVYRRMVKASSQGFEVERQVLLDIDSYLTAEVNRFCEFNLGSTLRIGSFTEDIQDLQTCIVEQHGEEALRFYFSEFEKTILQNFAEQYPSASEMFRQVFGYEKDDEISFMNKNLSIMVLPWNDCELGWKNVSFDKAVKVTREESRRMLDLFESHSVRFKELENQLYYNYVVTKDRVLYALHFGGEPDASGTMVDVVRIQRVNI